MNYEETLSTLKAIQASYSPMPFLLDPDVEPRFVINSDERTIKIPEEFKFLAVKMDHLSERIYFDIPRYFDGEDLATKICVVQYINANGDEAVEGIAAIVDVDYTSESGKIIFRWDVDNNVTKYAGDVSFSVRFYTIGDDSRFTYSWNTIPATLPVLDTIDNTGQRVTENYPTELLQWQYRMTELDRTISEKIATATESIDTNTKAAQAARQGAEDAESRVNAIVAGNEAYTKKQSHDLFALALKGAAEAAKSITIYPNKGSNVLATINGFTQQEGAGDPSPTNVREIINGGLKLVKLVLNGTEGWVLNPNSGTAASGSRRFQLGMSVTSSNASAYVVAVAYCSHFDGTTPANTYGSNYDNTFSVQNADLQLRVAGISAVDDLKRFLAARYAAGDPVIVWYVPADEADATGLYAPIILTSGEYRATCLPLTAPLCEGDSVASWAKSGCDKVVTFDGSENWTLVLSGNGRLRAYTPAAGCVPGTAVGDWLRKGTVDEWDANSGIGYVVTLQSGNIGVCVPTDKTTIQDFKAILAANPLTVWYRSTNYTEAADIAVSLETHVKHVFAINGTQRIMTYNQAEYFTVALPKPASSNYPTIKCDKLRPAQSGAKPYCYIADGAGYLLVWPSEDMGITDAVSAKEWLAAKPITVEYPIATPITYAHSSVELPALPDDTGKVTITGQSGGTVTVVFNKSITKAFEELVQRVSALELHALGG